MFVQAQDGVANDARDELRGSRMRRVRLDDDGVAGGERGRRITARDGESEREVARAEHCDRAERNSHRSHIRLGRRPARGVGRIDARIDP